MNRSAPVVTNAKSCIYLAALGTCAFLAGPIQAKEGIVTVKVSVTTSGLDVGQPAGGRELYRRLARAAEVVCGDRIPVVGLKAVESLAGCMETAIAEAVRSAKLPQLTLAYLRAHTLQQAAALGINDTARPPANR